MAWNPFQLQEIMMEVLLLKHVLANLMGILLFGRLKEVQVEKSLLTAMVKSQIILNEK